MRGKKSPKRKIKPDEKYKSPNVAKFINYLMISGKKSLAQSILYDAFEIVKEKSKKEPLEVFEKAIKNVSPSLEVRSRRIGGANYQIPVQVRSDRRFVLGSKWIIEAARSKKGKSMRYKLAEEFLDAFEGQGVAIKKKQDVHKTAEANRAFAHFARF